jgi:hypothetical protein
MIQCERGHDRGAHDAAMSRPIWHHHGDWCLCNPRPGSSSWDCFVFLLYPGLREDRRIVDGSTSDADIFGHGVGENGPIVLMLNNFFSKYLYEQGDDAFVGHHHRGDVLLRLGSTFALCRCTLGKDLFYDV